MVLSVAIPNRPILKKVLITCDWDECGRQAIRLYPRRASVRSKLSPFHFCSTRCQRLHWRERKRAEAELAAQATPRFCPACGENFCGPSPLAAPASTATTPAEPRPPECA